MERFNTYTVGQLQARLDKILPTIILLTDVWNNPTLTAHIISEWQIPFDGDEDEKRVKHLMFDIDRTDDAFDDLLLFIHNFCTKLCAEKLVLQFMIEQKSADIAHP